MRLLVLSLLFACSTPNTPTANQTTQIQTTAKELIAAYEANEISADQSYKGKIVEVSGSVSSVSKDLYDEPFVTLAGNSSDFREIQCAIKEVEAAWLKKKQKIVIKGRVVGLLINVLLEECSVLP